MNLITVAHKLEETCKQGWLLCVPEKQYNKKQKCLKYRHFSKTTAVCDETEKKGKDRTICELKSNSQTILVGTGASSTSICSRLIVMLAIYTGENILCLLIIAKSVPSQYGSSGRCLYRISLALHDRVFLFPLDRLDASPSQATPQLSLVPIFTPGWRDAIMFTEGHKCPDFD